MPDIGTLIKGVKDFFGSNSSVPTIGTTDTKIDERGNLAGGKPNTDFYARTQGESSTSRYIQANTTTPEGGLKAQPERIPPTPADKVQEPQLKTDTQKLSLMRENFIAKLLGIPLPILITGHSNKISEPKPTDDKAEYGKIQVKENKAGFVEVRDETPGNVRKVDLHPSGTYESMLDNGDVHQKVCGKKFTYVDKDWSIMVFGEEITVISGSETVHIKKDKVENVNGDKTLNTDGDSFSKVGKNHTQEVVKDYSTKIGGNEGRKVDGDQKENVDGGVTRKVGRDVVETVGGGQTETIRGALQIAVGGNVSIVAGGTVSITSGSLITLSAPMVEIN
jgi:hypothetical protein